MQLVGKIVGQILGVLFLKKKARLEEQLNQNVNLIISLEMQCLEEGCQIMAHS